VRAPAVTLRPNQRPPCLTCRRPKLSAGRQREETPVPHRIRSAIVAAVGVTAAFATTGATAGAGPASAGTTTGATLLAYSPTHTSYTGIDPGKGLYYSYAPSTVQTNPTTRYVFYCGNLISGDVKDHIFLSVGHQNGGQWRYTKPVTVFGPENGPSTAFFSVHTCEPEVIGGNFHFGGTPFKWAMFFTAEAVADNSTNVIGVAFANSLAGPWKPDLTPFVQTSDDFGQNSYPNNCPVDQSTGQTLYCLGEPAATSIGGGHVLLTYMGNAGSPGTDADPIEGLVLRVANLSNVPRTGPCATCFATLPTGREVEAVTLRGLATWPHDASVAYDPVKHRVAMSFDDGPYNSTLDGAPVTPVVTEATIPLRGLLQSNGTWLPQGSIGECLSGYTYNHNSGIVRTANGDLPSSNRLELLYAMADNNITSKWGVWDYRLWDTAAPLTSAPSTASVASASATCQGLTVVDTNGHVTTGGSAHGAGSLTETSSPVKGLALTPDRRGYYLVAANGQVSTFGDAVNRGSSASSGVVGIAVDSTSGGYWMVRSNGTVKGFGAPVLGSARVTSTSGPVVAIAAIPNGRGYYEVTAGGSVSAFGNAQNFGSATVPTGQTVAAMATTPNGLGYYLVTKQGTLAAYGDAKLFSAPSVASDTPVTGLAVASNGFGYWVLSSAGVVTGYGSARSTLLPSHAGTATTVALVTG
jgi:hypothetical protein